MSFKIHNEQTLVNTVPVDSVGGAKPEPEERPLETHTRAEAVSPRPLQAHELAPQRLNIVVSEAIGDAKERLGKQCGHCKHFNAEQGRYLLSRIVEADRRGDPQATDYLKMLRAHTLGEKGAAFDPEIYTSDPHAPDLVDKYIAELGFCRAYSELMRDVMLQHPTETCPSNTGLQEMADYMAGWPESHRKELEVLKPSEILAHASRPKPLPILYEARDSVVDKLTQQLLDDVMFKADAAKKL